MKKIYAIGKNWFIKDPYSIIEYYCGSIESIQKNHIIVEYSGKYKHIYMIGKIYQIITKRYEYKEFICTYKSKKIVKFKSISNQTR